MDIIWVYETQFAGSSPAGVAMSLSLRIKFKKLPEKYKKGCPCCAWDHYKMDLRDRARKIEESFSIEEGLEECVYSSTDRVQASEA